MIPGSGGFLPFSIHAEAKSVLIKVLILTELLGFGWWSSKKTQTTTHLVL